MLFQFYVAGGRLSCQLYQRSADTFLGMVMRQVIARIGKLVGHEIFVGVAGHLAAGQADRPVGSLLGGRKDHLANSGAFGHKLKFTQELKLLRVSLSTMVLVLLLVKQLL